MKSSILNLILSGTAVIFILLCGCGKKQSQEAAEPARVLHTTTGGKINTLDPALCADLTSANMVGELYDTLLEYNYTVRPYRLQPSMLEKMPEVSEDMKCYRFHLRDDLYFQSDKCFGYDSKGKPKKRKITAKDAVFSILRLADERLHSPGYWLIRGKIKSIGQFRKATSKLQNNDFSIYDNGCDGIKIVDENTFEIILEKPDPRFLTDLQCRICPLYHEKRLKCTARISQNTL